MTQILCTEWEILKNAPAIFVGALFIFNDFLIRVIR